MIDTIKNNLLHYQPKLLNSRLPQAGVLIAITDENEPKVILTRRAKTLSSHGGEVAFPGGKRDKSDSDIVFTALREAHEEIDLEPAQVNVLGRMDESVSLHRLQVTPCVGVIPANIKLQANLDELDSIFKVPLSFFLDDNNRCDHLEDYRLKARFAPCFLFDDYLIWGLTSYMLMDFLNVSLSAEIALKPRPKH
jgi:8-oxo-dGTP pyrophosphatase MutT (NUDIX family)